MLTTVDWVLVRIISLVLWRFLLKKFPRIITKNILAKVPLSMKGHAYSVDIRFSMMERV